MNTNGKTTDRAIEMIAQGLRMLVDAGANNQSPKLRTEAQFSSLKNPKLFKPSGRLNEQGVDEVNALFEQGVSKADVARRMGITYRSAQLREVKWQAAKRDAERVRSEAAERRRTVRAANKANAVQVAA